MRRNLCHGHLCIDEEVLRLADAAECDVLHRRQPDFLFEQMRKIIWIGVGGAGDVLQTDGVLVVLVDIGARCTHG